MIFKDIVKLVFSHLRNTMVHMRVKFRRKVTGEARPRLFIEGDSWVCYPTGQTKDLTLHLLLDFNVHVVALAGNIMVEYIRPKNLEMLEREIKEHGSQILLVSGGGNDIIKKHMDFFLHKNPGAQSAEDHIDFDALGRSIAEIVAIQERLFLTLSKKFPKLLVFTHGYVDAFPTIEKEGALLGPWVGPKLQELEIEPLYWHDIVKNCFEAYRVSLKEMSARYDNYYFVDINTAFRNHVGWWVDEIHLTKGGFALAARKLKREMLMALAKTTDSG